MGCSVYWRLSTRWLWCAYQSLFVVIGPCTPPQARDAFKTEYEVLCKLPLHDNIIKLHAFFFDRFDPKIHPAVKEQPGSRSVSLFLIMELHPTSMDKVMEERYRQRGPKVCGADHKYADRHVV